MRTVIGVCPHAVDLFIYQTLEKVNSNSITEYVYVRWQFVTTTLKYRFFPSLSLLF